MINCAWCDEFIFQSDMMLRSRRMIQVFTSTEVKSQRGECYNSAESQCSTGLYEMTHYEAQKVSKDMKDFHS